MASAARTRRQRAALPGSGAHRRIAALKLLLPLAALATTALVLGLSLAPREEFSFILSRERIATSRERLRLSGAVYSGADSAGRPFSVRAGTAVQHSARSAVVELRGLSARIERPAGPAEIIAPAGRYDIEAETLIIDGPVMARQGGYALDAGRLRVNLATQRAISEGAVSGRAPLGRFAAGGFEADVAGERLLLTKGARLRIARRAAK